MISMEKGYFYLFLNIFFTVYSQIVLKWQLNLCGDFPEQFKDKILFFISFIFKPWVFSSLLAVVFASVTWILTLSRLELSSVYPFTMISFVIILILSSLIFQESVDKNKILGVFFILVGLIFISNNYLR